MDTGYLLSHLFGEPVEPTAFVTLKGDASSRKYHRVELPEGRSPRTLIIMELPDDALASDELGAAGTPEELPFLNVGRHFEAAGLRVPRIHLDAVADGAVVLEDLGDDLFFDRVEGADEGGMRPWYAAAAELAGTMHRALWPIPPSCVAADKAFDYDLLRWELDHYREWGAEVYGGGPLAPSVRARLDAAFDTLAREVAALPRGFVHRDFQSRNLMVLDDDPRPKSLAIIDFQDALAGPRAYDLVALLNDSYVDVPESLKEEIVAGYAERAGIDPEVLIAEFHLVTVQRKLKDGGRFVFIDRVKGNPWFLPFVDGSFARVRSSLERLEGHDELRASLAVAHSKCFD